MSNTRRRSWCPKCNNYKISEHEKCLHCGFRKPYERNKFPKAPGYRDELEEELDNTQRIYKPVRIKYDDF